MNTFLPSALFVRGTVRLFLFTGQKKQFLHKAAENTEKSKGKLPLRKAGMARRENAIKDLFSAVFFLSSCLPVGRQDV